MYKKILGYLLIIFSIFYSVFIFSSNNIILKYFGGKYDKIIINTNVAGTVNGQELAYDNKNYFIEINDKVTDLYLVTEKPASYVEIFKGEKNFYGLANLKDTSINLISITGNNQRNLFTISMLFILSLFMVPKFYFLSYILFFLGLFLVNPKRVNPKTTLGIILLLSLLLRLSTVFEYPFWIDEVYTFINGQGTWKTVFADYCNPPLFYIISKLWLMVVPEAYCRLLSVFVGVGGVWAVYYLLNKKTNEKTALVGALLMATSYWGIYYSQDYRGYALLMFLVPLCSLTMFNFLERRETKDFFLYSFLSALIVNTHVFGILYVIGNYLFLFYKNFKNKCHLLKKIILSVIVVITSFLPYLFMTFLPHSIFSGAWEHNYFIATLKVLSVFYVVLFVVAVLVLYMMIFKNKDFKEYIKQSVNSKDFFLYCIYIILVVFVLSLLISLVKSVLYFRYYSVIYPFVICIISIIISQNWKNKYSSVLLVFLIILNIIFQFKLNFPLNLRYENFYNVIKFEKENNIAKGNIEVVLDYMTLYHNYYNLKDVKISLWRRFLPEYLGRKNYQDTIYIDSFEKDKQKFIDDFNFTVIVMPNEHKLIRIERW